MAVAKRTHHNGRYEPELLAREKKRFERGDPAGEIADELGVERNSVYRIAKKYGWTRPEPPPRGLPAAARLKEQAEALEESGADGPENLTENSTLQNCDASFEARPTAEHLRMRRLRLARPASTRSSMPTTHLPHPEAPERSEGLEGRSNAPAGPTQRSGSEPAADVSTLDRLERAVLEELATVEAARKQLGPLPKTSYQAQQTARTLATLTQTLQTLQRMRAARAGATGSDHDDDMPADIDAFRYDLARRIDAFVASRIDAARADGDAEPAALEAIRS